MSLEHEPASEPLHISVKYTWDLVKMAAGETRGGGWDVCRNNHMFLRIAFVY